MAHKHQLYGMEADLHLTDKQYLICLSIYFIPYSLFEVSSAFLVFSANGWNTSPQVPSNIVIRRARPSIWLSIIMILWGMMMVR